MPGDRVLQSKKHLILKEQSWKRQPVEIEKQSPVPSFPLSTLCDFGELNYHLKSQFHPIYRMGVPYYLLKFL